MINTKIINETCFNNFIFIIKSLSFKRDNNIFMALGFILIKHF